MGASESKPGPPGPQGPKGDKGDKGDRGDKGDSVTPEMGAQGAAQTTENQRRLSEIILPELLGTGISESNKTLQQKNNDLRIKIEFLNNTPSDLFYYLSYYLRANPLVTNANLISQGNSWIQQNTINIPLDRTNEVTTKSTAISAYMQNIPEPEKTIFSNYLILNNYNAINYIKYIVRYVVNNPTLTQEQLNTNIKTYYLNVARGIPTPATQPVQTTQGFTNYSTGIDYSKISVTNRPYSIKQKLTGSLFSPIV